MATSQGRIDIASIEKWIIEHESRHNGVNIVAVGETGVGKSTLVNGLVGEDVMLTSKGAGSVTQGVTEYKGTRNYLRIFDTPGLFKGQTNIVADFRENQGKDRFAGLLSRHGSLRDHVQNHAGNWLYCRHPLFAKNPHPILEERVLCLNPCKPGRATDNGR